MFFTRRCTQYYAMVFSLFVFHSFSLGCTMDCGAHNAKQPNSQPANQPANSNELNGMEWKNNNVDLTHFCVSSNIFKSAFTNEFYFIFLLKWLYSCSLFVYKIRIYTLQTNGQFECSTRIDTLD